MSGVDSDVNYKFDTYKERCELFEGKGAIRYSPYPGMEVALFHSTVSEIANCFMTRDSLFNGMTAEPIVRRQLMTAPLMGTGTIDLIGALDSSQEDIPPILFAHKPDLSFRDMICFQVALRRDLRLEYREGKIVFEGTHAKLISAPMRGYIAQSIEQLHLNRARRIVLGGWQTYIVLQLTSSHEIEVSDIVLGDRDYNSHFFDEKKLLDQLDLPANYEGAADVRIMLTRLASGRISLLEMIVALLMSPRENALAISSLWQNPDTLAELRREAKMAKAKVGTGPVLEDQEEELPPVPTVDDVNVRPDENMFASLSSTPSSSNPTDEFTVITSTVSYEAQHRQLMSAIPLPSDDTTWGQMVPGCWSPTACQHRTLPPSSPPLDLLDLVPAEGSPSPRSIGEQDFTSRLPVKTSRLTLGAYIGSGRLYHAYRGTLTIVHVDDTIPTSTLPVAKYANLDHFHTTVNREDPEHAWDYDKEEASEGVQNEVNILQYLFKRPAARKHVPHFHGLLNDTQGTGNMYWMILEDCGEAADLSDARIQKYVVEAYDTLHIEARVVHSDVQARHITVDSKGAVRIVDWEAGHKLDNWSFDGGPTMVIIREKSNLLELLRNPNGVVLGSDGFLRSE